MNSKNLLLILMISFFTGGSLLAQQSIYEPIDLEDVEYSLKDFGKMWTFDDIPYEYWENEYGFKPSDEWLDDVQKSALQFGNGCSAAFVSPDGLIMTNHHCGRHGLASIQKEGEDLMMEGFYAEVQEDERKIPGFFADQLISIEDVTGQVIEAMNKGETDSAKVENRNEIIKTLQEDCEDGLICKVVVLYNGGKYSLYKYKRYTDIRLVMSPEFQIASTGWDWDNFTYPRYELDFMFLRAYDSSGSPVHTDHYFNWSKNGAEEGEPIFVVGRPGDTDRLLSVAELKYLRDKVYPNTLSLLNGIYNTYYDLYEKYPERESELLHRLMSVGNGRKVYAGLLDGLNDQYLMKRKEVFEESFKEKVKNDPELNKQYGKVWESISNSLDELRNYIDHQTAFTRYGYGQSEYFAIAKDLIDLANQMKLSEADRNPEYKEDELEKTLDNLFPVEFDKELNDELAKAHLLFVAGVLGEDHPLVEKMFMGEVNEETARLILNKSMLTSKESVKELAAKSPDEILNSDDPFIHFLQSTEEDLKNSQERIAEIRNTLQVLNQQLGELSFKVYGDRIPPDATITLRISDGVLAPYEYNGTIAPKNTTYYGMYDRFYSFDQETYPWGLPDRWKNPPADFVLSTPLNLASTNDIVGGNSGSSMINKNAEIVGLVFDGNMESLPGKFIFLPESNRTIAVDSRGLMEALKKIYKAERLVNELQN